MDNPAALGRRERKRLETRTRLMDAALKLFAERGFDEVTVAEIADEADADPSTFFRHFGSKDAVLFSDVTAFQSQLHDALLAQPADLGVFDALASATAQMAPTLEFDATRELLRARLADSSPTLRTLGLSYREDMVEALVDAIEERAGTDATIDPYPVLMARLWVTGFEWYRRRAINQSQAATTQPTDDLAPTPSEILSEVLDILRPIWPA